MSQTAQLITTLKRLLKSQGITYAQVGQHLALSEASVKRQFSQHSFSLHTLEAICDLLEMDFGELIREAEQGQSRLSALSTQQEAELVARPTLLLVTVCVLNHWSLTQIVTTYQLSEAECIRELLLLDRLGLITLLPENRVRLKVARDFTWLPDGPIRRFFRERVQTEFLDGPFEQEGALLRFQHAMLSPAANAKFQLRLKRLLQEFSELHQDCIDSPQGERYGTSLLLALRPWEPTAFADLRRSPDERPYG